MKFTSTTAGALFAGLALASPAPKADAGADVHPALHEVAKRQGVALDDVVLQFALTLEHLENVFYKGALTNFSQADFAAAGYGADYYNNLLFIAHDEEVHVQALTAALVADGVQANAACTYSFPYTDVLSFITLSSILEGVGTSAYLGAAPLITSKYYLTVAGSILVTEALHTSYQRSVINEVPMANPFGTPLDPNAVYTLALAFITSCPAGNMALPFTAFPSLAVSGSVCTCEEPNCSPPKIQKKEAEPWGRWAPTSTGYHSTSTTTGTAKPTATGLTDTCTPPSPGANATFTAGSNIPSGSYVTFVNGLDVTSVAGSVSGKSISAAIPAADMGQTYVFVTKSSVTGNFSDAAVLFGPAILEVYPATPVINYNIL